MVDYNQKINDIIGEGGLQVSVGVKPSDILLLGLGILIATVLGGVISHLITKNI